MHTGAYTFYEGPAFWEIAWRYFRQEKAAINFADDSLAQPRPGLNYSCVGTGAAHFRLLKKQARVGATIRASSSA